MGMVLTGGHQSKRVERKLIYCTRTELKMEKVLAGEHAGAGDMVQRLLGVGAGTVAAAGAAGL
jgi:hypothetical protein